MADTLGVTSTASPTEGNVDTDVTAQSSGAQGVTPDSPAGDRTQDQMFRELQRRDQERQKQLDQVLAYLVSGQQQRQAGTSQTTPKAPPTDEELWAQAQQGDRIAFEEYQGRIADRRIAQNSGVTRNQQMVTGQLTALVGKYPMLNNPAHPLAQTMQQAYQLLLQNYGYPAGQATLLEAAKTAIADRPDLVAEAYTQTAQAREQVRQDGTRRAQSGQMGATHRQDSRTNAGQPKVSPEQAQLAARMGIKDPAGAMARFRKRQEGGQSSFGSVAAFIPEEDQ
jgi:hypothetical protein